jgi:hypothetical protein
MKSTAILRPDELPRVMNAMERLYSAPTDMAAEIFSAAHAISQSITPVADMIRNTSEAELKRLQSEVAARAKAGESIVNW